jgi:rhodanese-related sulfurtransferase
MKKFVIHTFLFASVLFFYSCTGANTKENKVTGNEKTQSESPSIKIGTETGLLLKELESGGDYVNSREYPSLIKASLVFEGLSAKNLVVDIRSSTSFASGHIKGAVNMKFQDLPSYFETGIKPFEYERIILVDEDGQLSSYATSLLRLKGYGNVFAMRWGMSAWSRKLQPSAWLNGRSSEFEAMLDTVTHERPVPEGMPELNTGLQSGNEISNARFASLFSEGTADVLISAKEVFSAPSAYFIINFERKDKYSNGHIPGALRYKPDATLGIASEMATIPYNKTVVVYCGTGHNSAFASAYLRLFGYDARTLRFGNHSFMFDKMQEEKAQLSWVCFSETDINDFPLVK